MILLRQPTTKKIAQFLETQNSLDYSYAAVGKTAGTAPPGFTVDHTRVVLGQGRAAFTAARQCLREWRQFALPWVSVEPSDAPPTPGAAVAIVAQSVGLWWVNACRIVYVIDEDRRFGFAYGALPDHVGRGEERFLVEIDDAGEVTYDLLAFSQPQYILASVAYPYLRYMQKRFGRQSAAAMQRGVAELVK